MAVMIPAECRLHKRPISEQIVFGVLKDNLSDDWTIFHSFDYLLRNCENKFWEGEIDFLLYNPEYGLMVLEVKGGQISYRNGQWFQEDRVIDPVKQASNNKFAVIELLRSALNIGSVPLKTAHAVCFPSCGYQEIWPPAANGIVLTGDMFGSVESFVKSVFKCIPDPPPGYIMPEDIIRILSPFFEYGMKLEERIGCEEEQFFRLTSRQCMVLDTLRYFKRLQVKGCAGSGKTVMAVKKAKALAADGKRVLLLCFNHLLAQNLKKAVRDEPLIKAEAFFEFCVELMKIPAEKIDQYRDNPKLYSDVLPKTLLQYLKKVSFSYDAVIVDEGQDFSENSWQAIESLVCSDGWFYIFYDPDQNIYSGDLKLPQFDVPPVVLDRNCRNTQRIFEILKPYQTISAGCFEDAPLGNEVRVISGSCRQNLAAELERLVMDERIALTDIIILGGHSMEHTSLGNDPQLGRFTAVSRRAQVGKSEVAYFTYMKFKGCEAKVVILYEVDENDPRWQDSSGIYTAMSRAVHELIIIHR